MGLNFDLAAVAGMAGLGGSAVAALGTAMFFKGLLMRILAQVIVTAGLSFVGFIALLNVLGFEINKKPVIEISTAPDGSATFAPASTPVEVTTITSPWSN